MSYFNYSYQNLLWYRKWATHFTSLRFQFLIWKIQIGKSAIYLTPRSIEGVKVKGYEKMFYKYKGLCQCRYYFINVPTRDQICYLLIRDSFTLRKTGQWLRYLEIIEHLMNRGFSRPSALDWIKYSLHPTKKEELKYVIIIYACFNFIHSSMVLVRYEKKI